MISFLEFWNKSIKEYEKYALTYPQYIKSNEKLVEISEIKSGQVVVDLGCGTGLTTKEVLKRVPDIKKVYAVDFSEGMINIARAYIQSKKVVFITADVKDLSNIISEKVDFVLCNSSFWFFRNENEVIDSINQILKDNGIFVFNVPLQDDEYIQNIKIIMKAIFSEMRKRGYSPKIRKWAHKRWSNSKIRENRIKNLFENNIFNIESIEYYDIGSRSLEDFFCFFRIPVMAPFFEEVPKEGQEQILNSAYNELKNSLDGIEKNIWIYFVMKKNSKP